MTNLKPALGSLSDHQLHQYTVRSASAERGAKAASVAALTEVARRKLYLRYASSLALYAQRELGYSEASAYRHSQAAFLAREFPEVIEKLESGQLSLDAATQAARAFREHDRKAVERPSPKTEQRALQPSLGILRVSSSVTSERKMGYAGATADPSLASGERGSSPSLDTRPKKLSKHEKRKVLHAIASQPRSVVQRKLGELRANGQGGGDGRSVKTRPHARLDSFDGNWSELRVYLSGEESAKLQHLRNLLSRALPSLDLNAIFVRLLEEALDRHDPVRQEERTLRRKAKAALKNQALFRDAALLRVKVAHGQPMTSKYSQTMKAADQKAPPNAARLSPQSSASPLPSRAKLRRVPLSPTLERKVRVRDENRCQYPVLDALTREKRLCGSERFTQIDHIHPVSRGGTNEITNLRVTCSSHNVHRMLLERRKE